MLLNQITASNFRIMGILVDLRELCERSREVDVVDRQKQNENIKIKLIHCFWTYIWTCILALKHKWWNMFLLEIWQSTDLGFPGQKRKNLPGSRWIWAKETASPRFLKTIRKPIVEDCENVATKIYSCSINQTFQHFK